MVTGQLPPEVRFRESGLEFVAEQVPGVTEGAADRQHHARQREDRAVRRRGTVRDHLDRTGAHSAAVHDHVQTGQFVGSLPAQPGVS